MPTHPRTSPAANGASRGNLFLEADPEEPLTPATTAPGASRHPYRREPWARQPAGPPTRPDRGHRSPRLRSGAVHPPRRETRQAGHGCAREASTGGRPRLRAAGRPGRPPARGAGGDGDARRGADRAQLAGTGAPHYRQTPGARASTDHRGRGAHARSGPYRGADRPACASAAARPPSARERRRPHRPGPRRDRRGQAGTGSPPRR